jgi:vacuolar-type H+-ATPase subunit H
MLEFIPFYIAIVIIVVLLTNFLVLYYTYHLYTRNKKIEEFIYTKGSNILDQANSKAKTIVESAVWRAKKTLSETDYLRDDLINKMEGFLEEAAKKDAKDMDSRTAEVDEWYKKMLMEIKDQHVKKADDTLHEIEKLADQQIAELGQVLKKETIQVEESMSKKVDAEYQTVHKEIEEYKKKTIEEIKQSVSEIIKKTTAETLSSQLTPELHEELIMNALERAQRDGALKV